MPCRTLDLMHLIGKKWTVVLLEEIALGKFGGFNRILKKSGLTPRILSNQLKEMESSGIISKIMSKNTTVYKLTKKGTELRHLVTEIKNFSRRWDNAKEPCYNKSCLDCSEFEK